MISRKSKQRGTRSRISEQQEQNIKPLVQFVIIAALAGVLAGCSSSDQATDDSSLTELGEFDTLARPQATQPEQSVPAQRPKSKQNSHTSAQRFSMQADTVDVLSRKKQGAPTSTISVKASTPKKFYTVEIGAFRQQGNIKRHQRQLAQRFTLPVRVLYDSTISLTRVCIGTFSTKSLALNFMKKLQSQYPKDYPDCWVSYWTK